MSMSWNKVITDKPIIKGIINYFFCVVVKTSSKFHQSNMMISPSNQCLNKDQTLSIGTDEINN